MFGFKCVIYMGGGLRAAVAECVPDENAGAEVVPVKAGQQTLKEAISEAMRDWVTNVRTTHYILARSMGASISVDGAQFPSSHRRRSARQILEKEGGCRTCSLPAWRRFQRDGIVLPFLKDESVR